MLTTVRTVDISNSFKQKKSNIKKMLPLLSQKVNVILPELSVILRLCLFVNLPCKRLFAKRNLHQI